MRYFANYESLNEAIRTIYTFVTENGEFIDGAFQFETIRVEQTGQEGHYTWLLVDNDMEWSARLDEVINAADEVMTIASLSGLKVKELKEVAAMCQPSGE